MYTRPAKFPCGSGKFTKRGYYRPRSNNYQPIPRYHCKACKRTFSRQSEALSDTYRQKKPELNEQVFKWYAYNNSYKLAALFTETAT